MSTTRKVWIVKTTHTTVNGRVCTVTNGYKLRRDVIKDIRRTTNKIPMEDVEDAMDYLQKINLRKRDYWKYSVTFDHATDSLRQGWFTIQIGFERC